VAKVISPENQQSPRHKTQPPAFAALTVPHPNIEEGDFNPIQSQAYADVKVFNTYTDSSRATVRLLQIQCTYKQSVTLTGGIVFYDRNGRERIVKNFDQGQKQAGDKTLSTFTDEEIKTLTDAGLVTARIRFVGQRQDGTRFDDLSPPFPLTKPSNVRRA
jgi:hypothetical protein